jgi:hypothetical protein
MDHHPVSGGAITARGRFESLPGLPLPWCDGPVAARAKVREVLRMGADVIKVAMTGSMTFPARRPHRPLFTQEELEAIVDEAHLEGVPVCCHAHGDPYEDVRILQDRRRLDAVIKGGELMHGSLPPASGDLDRRLVESTA